MLIIFWLPAFEPDETPVAMLRSTGVMLLIYELFMLLPSIKRHNAFT
jgi:hypothetical protein